MLFCSCHRPPHCLLFPCCAQAKLAYAKRVGSLQREVESSEGREWGGVRAALAEAQQRELSEMRGAHEAAMDRVGAQREAQVRGLTQVLLCGPLLGWKRDSAW